MRTLHLEVEDRGQDCIWFEIDADTGLIVNCGPFQQHIWADGDHHMSIESIAVGKRPTISWTRPRGTIVKLNYEIKAIGTFDDERRVAS